MGRQYFPRVALIVIATLLFAIVGLRIFWPVHGMQASNRYMRLGDNRAGTTTEYTVGFDVRTSATLGSIRVQFCANDPLIGTPCTAPSGFDISSATLTNQAGVGGFSISPLTTANVLILTRPAFKVNPTPVNYELSGVVNPSSDGPYFARIETFSSTDATGPHIDYGGLAFYINSPVDITTTVPPYLLFCSGVTISGFDCSTASGDYVNFGELSSVSARTGSTQLLVGTNAFGGYSISVNGTTMESGTNIIPPLANGDVSRPGVSQFGLNLRANADPPTGQDPFGPGSGTVTANYDVPDRFRFDSGDIIAGAPTVDDYRQYTVSYLVNVARDQAPGDYVSTMTYICLANF